MMKEHGASFGAFAKEGRKRKKLTQVEVAEQLDVTQAYYSQIESDKRNVDLAMAIKICAILSIDLRDYVGEYNIDSATDNLLENVTGTSIGVLISERLNGKIEKKSEGKSVSIYLTTKALENLDKFARANGCSRSKAADFILKHLY